MSFTSPYISFTHRLRIYLTQGISIKFMAVANSGALDYEDSVAGPDEFNAYWARSPNQILHRKCLDCSSADHQNIYYRRFDENGLPVGFDLYDLFLNNWFSDPEIQHNTFGVDFKLYSTYEDAVADQNKWTFCNFNDPGVGFPRECGPNGKVDSQWNSFEGRSGRRLDIGFYVETAILECHAFEGPHKTCSGYDTGLVEGVAFERKGACAVTESVWRDCDDDVNRNSCLEACEAYGSNTLREGCCSYRASLVSDEYVANNNGSNGCFFSPGPDTCSIPPSNMIHVPNTYCEYYAYGGDRSFEDVWQQCIDDGPDKCMGIMWNSSGEPTSNTSVNGAWKLMTAGQDVGDANNPTQNCGGKEQALGHWDVFLRGPEDCQTLVDNENSDSYGSICKSYVLR